MKESELMKQINDKQKEKMNELLEEMGADPDKKPRLNHGFKGVLNYKSATLNVQAEIRVKTMSLSKDLDKTAHIIRRTPLGETLVFATIDKTAYNDKGEPCRKVVTEQSKGYVPQGSTYDPVIYGSKNTKHYITQNGEEKPVKQFTQNLNLELDATDTKPNTSIDRDELPLYLAGETKLLKVWSPNLSLIKQICDDLRASRRLPTTRLVLRQGFTQYLGIAMPLYRTNKQGEEVFALTILATKKKIAVEELYEQPTQQQLAEAQEDDQAQTLELEIAE